MLNEILLDEKLSELEQQRTWSPRVIAKFETLIRQGSDEDLFRLNPIHFAKTKNIRETEAIDLCLFAAKIELMQMDWLLVCASCGGVVESFCDLHDVHAHFICNICSGVNRANLDDYIQVSFTVVPSVRRIIYHQPEQLPIEVFYRHYRASKGILPFPDGTSFLDFIMGLMKVTAYIPPNETRQFNFDVTPGLLKCTDLMNEAGFALLVDEAPLPANQSIAAALTEDKFKVLDADQTPLNVANGEFQFQFKTSLIIPRGQIDLTIANHSENLSAFCVLYLPADLELQPLQFEPFLSGRQLLSTQTFRDLFRTQLIRDAEGIGVRDLTYLFTDLKGSTNLYDKIGDLNAFYLVRQHFEILTDVVRQHKGAIVKTIGDAIMATFLEPHDAVQAGLAMLKAFEVMNTPDHEPLILKIGVHRGHSIAVAFNDNIDYFGQVVNMAARIQGLAEANEVCVSREVYQVIPEVLQSYGTTPEVVLLKGIEAKATVYRLKIQ